MTVGNFILALRRRLQDLRTSAGTIITAADTNGIRWSANDLMDKLNETLDQVSRMLIIYDKSPLVMQLTENQLIIKKSLTFTSRSASLANDEIGVLGFEKDGTQQEYTYIPPMRLRSYEDSPLPSVKNSQYFTVVRDVTTLVKKVLITTSETSLEATILVQPPNFDFTDLAQEIYFQGIDDFILLVAEKLCRSEEGFYDRVGQIMQEIKVSLGIVERSQNG